MARPLFARSSSRSEPLHRPAPGPAGTALKAAVWRYSSPLPVLTGLQAVLKNMSLLSVFKVRFTLPAPSLLPACAHPSGRVGALTYPFVDPKFPRLRPHMPQPYTSPQNAQVWEQASIDEFEKVRARGWPALIRPRAPSDAPATPPRLFARRSSNLLALAFPRSRSSPNPASSTSDAANTYWHGAPRSA